MNVPKIRTLERTEWEEISRLWPGTRSLLSPVDAPGAAVLSPTESRNFVDAGWIEPSGEVAVIWHPALEALASTRCLAELTIGSHGEPATYDVYFDGAAQDPRSTAGDWGIVTDEQDRVTLYEAETVRKLANDAIDSIVQDSTSAATPAQESYFSAGLELSEAWILAVMLDMQRQADMRAAAQNPSRPVEATPCVCEAEAIGNIMGNLGSPQNSGRAFALLADEPGWATLFFLSGMIRPLALSLENVEETLRDLAAARLVVPQGPGYSLENGPRRFAAQFLAPSGTAFLRTCQEQDDELHEDQLTCLWAGNTCLYAWMSEQAPDLRNLSAGSFTVLADAVRRIFAEPASLNPIQERGLPSAAQSANLPASLPRAAIAARTRPSTRLLAGLGITAIISCCCIAGGIGLIATSYKP